MKITEIVTICMTQNQTITIKIAAEAIIYLEESEDHFHTITIVYDTKTKPTTIRSQGDSVSFS